MQRKIVIMTSSAKNGNCCVAGFDEEGKWIRLVTDNEALDGAIPRAYMQNITVLDYVELDIVKGCGDVFQPENYLVNLHMRPKKIGHVAWKKFLKVRPTDSYNFIFGNCSRRLEVAEAQNVGHSLEFVKVQQFHSYVDESRHKTRAEFYYNGNFYSRISVTDQDYFDRECRYEEAYLVMSLAHKPYFGTDGTNLGHFKFVAKVFQSDIS